MKRKELVLIRHAEGEHNVKGGSFSFDPPLTAKGRQQCRDARRELRKEGELDLICVSPLRRTLETADLCFKDERCDRVAVEMLRERTKGSCNWRRRVDEQQQDFPGVNYRHIAPGLDPHLNRRDEPVEEVYDRSLEFLQWLADQPETRVAVVSHWQVLYHGLLPILDPEADSSENSFKNCEYTFITWDYNPDFSTRPFRQRA